MARPDMEFFDTDTIPWNKIADGIYEKILSKDEETGAYTRLLKFEPGAEIPNVLTHDFFEEVYIVKGVLIDKRLNKTFTEGMYAFRNPGMEHGPFVSPTGCITFEIRYYGMKGKDEK